MNQIDESPPAVLTKPDVRRLQLEVQSTADKPREHWGNRYDFLFSIIGYAVDLSNLYRFPYICYKFGGGAFLIPYFTMCVLTSLPMLYLELLLGQRFQQGSVSIWRLCPLMTGIGVTQIIISFLIGPFYIVLIGYAAYLIVHSFSWHGLPWSSCLFEQATVDCLAYDTGSLTNISHLTNISSNSVLSTDEFFERSVLQIQLSGGLEDLGGIRWPLVACVLVSLLCMWTFLMLGVRASGKVVYVTAIVPYFILLILLVNGLFLPGSLDGLRFLLTPDFQRLLDFEVWYFATVQIFFSTGVGVGVHIALASFCERNHNFELDCVITSLANSMASLLSGAVVFSYLGYLAHILQRDIRRVINAGPTLVFQIYPFALTTMRFPTFWTILFFLLLLLLGVDSMMGGLESVLTGISDILPPSITSKPYWRKLSVALVTMTIFLISLVNVTKGGILVLSLMDVWVAGPIFLLAVSFQVIAICWIYGMDNLCEDVFYCLGRYPNYFWRICWKFVCPVTLLTLTLKSLGADFQMAYTFQSYMREWTNVTGFNQTSQTYLYPRHSQLLIWFYIVVEFLPIPILATYFLFKFRKNPLQSLAPISIEVRNHLLVDSNYHNRGSSRANHPETCRYGFQSLKKMFSLGPRLRRTERRVSHVQRDLVRGCESENSLL